MKRQLVITHSIEQIILMDSAEEASNVMTRTSKPRNVRSCFYFIEGGRGPAKALSSNSSGDMRDGPIRIQNRQPRMKTDAEQQIRYS